MRSYTFCVTRQSERIDRLLVLLFPKISRQYIQELLKKHNILCNGKKISAHYHPKRGDIISVNIPSLKTSGLIPSEIPIDILYEDNDIIVINKQPGIAVHPSDNGGNISQTIVNALLFWRKDSFSINGSKRPGIIHRLDKDTSGTLVIAKNENALHYLSKQWEERQVQKEYLTLVTGKLSPMEGVIEAPLGRSYQNRKTIGIRIGSSGKYALTKYTVKHYFLETTLLQVTIMTGRTHQIRVHCKAIGHPIVGDSTYGNKTVNDNFAKEHGLIRQFLHAETLSFLLPSTKKWFTITAPLTKDLQSVLHSLT